MVTRSHYNAPSGATVALSVRLDSDVHARLAAIGMIRGLSTNAMVNMACEAWANFESPAERSIYQATIDQLSGDDNS